MIQRDYNQENLLYLVTYSTHALTHTYIHTRIHTRTHIMFYYLLYLYYTKMYIFFSLNHIIVLIFKYNSPISLPFRIKQSLTNISLNNYYIKPGHKKKIGYIYPTQERRNTTGQTKARKKNGERETEMERRKPEKKRKK